MQVKSMGHAGMLPNYPDTKIEKPCEDECTILWQQSGLEYANGTIANIDSGLWYRNGPKGTRSALIIFRLHHMVHFNSGPTRWDATGWDYGILCAPFLGVMNRVVSSERFYTSGEILSIKRVGHNNGVG